MTREAKIPSHEEFDLKARRRAAALKGAATRQRNKDLREMEPVARKELPLFLDEVSKTLSAGELEFHGDFCELTVDRAEKWLEPRGWGISSYIWAGCLKTYKLHKIFS